MPLDPNNLSTISQLLHSSETYLRHLRKESLMSVQTDAKFFNAIQELTKARLLLNSEIQKMNSTLPSVEGGPTVEKQPSPISKVYTIKHSSASGKSSVS